MKFPKIKTASARRYSKSFPPDQKTSTFKPTNVGAPLTAIPESLSGSDESEDSARVHFPEISNVKEQPQVPAASSKKVEKDSKENTEFRFLVAFSFLRAVSTNAQDRYRLNVLPAPRKFF